MLKLCTPQMEDVLHEAGFLNTEKLQKIKELLAETGDDLEKILSSQGINQYKELLNLLAKKMGVDYVDLENICVNKNAVQKINLEIAEKYQVFPFEIKNHQLFLAMQNPDDIFLIDEIRMFSRMEIKPFLADVKMIRKAIKYFYADQQTVHYSIEPANNKKINEKKSQDFNKADTGKAEKGRGVALPQIQDKLNENINQTEEYLRKVLETSIKLGAEFIHIELYLNRLRIRYRVDNKFMKEECNDLIGRKELLSYMKAQAGLVSFGKVYSMGHISLELMKAEKINFEVLCVDTIKGEKIFIKVIKKMPELELENIGLNDYEKNTLESMLSVKSGIIIVTGPRNCGKSTTVNALLKRIFTDQFNVMTLEKRVMNEIEGVNQIQTAALQPDEISSLLKSAIDYDNDVIMIDTDVDRNIMKCLVDHALQGRLVLMTAPFQSISEAFNGLIQMGIDQYLLGSTVQGIITQRLVRKICPRCKNRYGGMNGPVIAGKPKAGQSEVQSCSECHGIGYKGKQGVFEILSLTREHRIKLSQMNPNDRLDKSFKNDKSNFKANCMKLVNDDITTIEEVLRLDIGKEIFC